MPMNANKRQQTPTNTDRILAVATPRQIKWLLVRLISDSDREAAKKAGIHPSTVSKWPNKAELDKAVNLLLREPVSAALTVLQKAAIDAASVLVDELKHKNKLRAADSILDRIGLRGPEKHEIAGKDGGAIALTFTGNVDPDDV